MRRGRHNDAAAVTRGGTAEPAASPVSTTPKLRDTVGTPLFSTIQVLYPDPCDAPMYEEVVNTAQFALPCLFAFQYALTSVWQVRRASQPPQRSLARQIIRSQLAAPRLVSPH